MTRHLLLFVLFFSLPYTLLADIDADQAYTIARAYAIAEEPALDSVATQVRSSSTDHAICMTLSDPYYLNGDKFWRTYRYYEYTEISISDASCLGTRTIASVALEPLPVCLPDDLRPRVLDWLAYWDSQSTMDPELLVGAAKTTVYVFFFKQGLWGPFCIVGVDSQGATFVPNTNCPLFPWRLSDERKQRYEALRSND